jgi:hypothetical protein
MAADHVTKYTGGMRLRPSEKKNCLEIKQLLSFGAVRRFYAPGAKAWMPDQVRHDNCGCYCGPLRQAQGRLNP